MIHDTATDAHVVFALRKIAEYPVRVSGSGGEPITQLFKMTVGMEFVVGGGFRAILRRNDHGGKKEDHIYEILNPFACLHDQSCQVAHYTQKNHQSFQMVLTSGDYVLELYDLSQIEYTEWLVEELGLAKVPLTIAIEALPIL